jgi:solute carrier family 13 (sodium-dependent dicarboxylate transporter), member 2/3/5
MNMQIVITIAILVLMIIGFMSGKFKLGLVGVTTATLLCLTGILKFEEAFGYFASNNVVMIAGMFVLVGALGKTSLVHKIHGFLLQRSKKGNTLVIIYFMGCFLLVQFISPLALISIVLPFMAALNEESNVQSSNLLLPGAALAHASQSAFPVGMGLTVYAMQNALLQANGAKVTLQLTDYSKIVIIPAIISLLYMSFIAWKKFPKTTIDIAQLGKDKEFKALLTPLQEKMVYAAFLIVLVGLMFGSKLPFPQYILPVIADIILMYCNALNYNDIKNFINLDSLFMLAGVLPLGLALQKTGADKLVAHTVVSMLGGKPSGLMLLIAFYFITAIVTQFMSNTACDNTFGQLAIVTAVAQGLDPRPFALAIYAAATFACLTPAGSPSIAIAFSAGQYKIKDALKIFTPLWFIYGIVIIFMANLIFPL